MEFEGQRVWEGEPGLPLRKVRRPSFERWPPFARRKDHPYFQRHKDTKRKLRPQTGHASPSTWRSGYKPLHVTQEIAPPSRFLLLVTKIFSVVLYVSMVACMPWRMCGRHRTLRWVSSLSLFMWVPGMELISAGMLLASILHAEASSR